MLVQIEHTCSPFYGKDFGEDGRSIATLLQDKIQLQYCEVNDETKMNVFSNKLHCLWYCL